jgi:hypothetical protein
MVDNFIDRMRMAIKILGKSTSDNIVVGKGCTCQVIKEITMIPWHLFLSA